MRDTRWFLLSGLVVVLWLSFAPRVAAAEIGYEVNDRPAAATAVARRGSPLQGITRLLVAPSPPAAFWQRSPQMLQLFEPVTPEKRLSQHTTTSQGRLVRCGGGFRYCLVAARPSQ